MSCNGICAGEEQCTVQTTVKVKGDSSFTMCVSETICYQTSLDFSNKYTLFRKILTDKEDSYSSFYFLPRIITDIRYDQSPNFDQLPRWPAISHFGHTSWYILVYMLLCPAIWRRSGKFLVEIWCAISRLFVSGASFASGVMAACTWARGFSSCNDLKCATNWCKCRNHKLLCNSQCHNSLSCCNTW